MMKLGAAGLCRHIGFEARYSGGLVDPFVSLFQRGLTGWRVRLIVDAAPRVTTVTVAKALGKAHTT
jgi:hypothetical protein